MSSPRTRCAGVVTDSSGDRWAASRLMEVTRSRQECLLGGGRSGFTPKFRRGGGGDGGGRQGDALGKQHHGAGVIGIAGVAGFLFLVVRVSAAAGGRSRVRRVSVGQIVQGWVDRHQAQPEHEQGAARRERLAEQGKQDDR